MGFLKTPCLHILSDGENSLSVRQWHMRGGANLRLNYHFSGKNVYIIMQVTILCQFKSLEILFPNINESINYKFLLWLRCLPPRPTSYLQYKRKCICGPRPRFAWILPNMQYYFPNHWSMQIIFYLCDKALILKRSLTLSNANTEIWSKKRLWILV